MKRFTYELDQIQLDMLFFPFREKNNIILFWMEVVKTVVSHVEPPKESIRGQMIISIDKMQRVFVQKDGKAFSASFPFSITEIDGFLSCKLKSGIEVNSKISSEVIGIIQSTLAFNNVDVLGFIDDISGASDDPDTLWQVLSELVRVDDGYIRIDHDPERVNGDIHPLNHLDLFYSQGATFKVGLNDRIHINDLGEILDRGTNCHYLMSR